MTTQTTTAQCLNELVEILEEMPAGELAARLNSVTHEIRLHLRDAERYNWLLAHATTSVGYTPDGDEINDAPWMHFDDTELGETMSEAIDRHVKTEDGNAVS